MSNQKIKKYQYKSALADDIAAFIDFKESVGIASKSRNYTLLRWGWYRKSVPNRQC